MANAYHVTRHRRSLLRDRVAAVNRVHNLLESANIRMSTVADVMGVSGRAMLNALAGGERDPETMAQLTRGCAAPSPTIMPFYSFSS